MLIRAIVLAALLSSSAPAQQVTAFTNGRWMNDDGTFSARTMYVTEFGYFAGRPRSAAAKTVDLHGAIVIPACGEAHNHNATNDNPTALNQYLHHGILYVKNPTNLPRQRVGELINSPKGVDVIFSNGGLTAPGGHPLGLVQRNIARGAMTEADGEGAFYHTIGSAADIDHKWPRIIGDHPDFIKTTLVYSEEYAKRKDDSKYFSRRGLDPALLPLIVKRAHASHLPVVTHVESATDFHNAVVAGVDEINHTPGFWPSDDAIAAKDFSRYRIREADAKLAAARNIQVVTTLGESIASKDLALRTALLDVYRWNLNVLKQHKVRVLIGSDQFRKDSQSEIKQLVESGLMTKPEALVAWCQTTPQGIFPRRKIGRLQPGFEANFVVLASDPLVDFNAIENVDATYKRGVKLYGR